jgi:hypothetical protein
MTIKRTNFLTKGYNALMTLAEWKRQGYPGRAPEDVKDLFDTHCSKCPLYDPNSRAVPLAIAPLGICSDRLELDGVKGCGCHVSPDAGEWTNALAVPVKPCPRNLFPHLVEQINGETK